MTFVFEFANIWLVGANSLRDQRTPFMVGKRRPSSDVFCFCPKPKAGRVNSNSRSLVSAILPAISLYQKYAKIQQKQKSKKGTCTFLEITIMRVEKLLLGVKKNILLKNYTTFRIGGRAKYFFVAKTKENLIKAITVAKKLRLPFFILGGGSNLLVSDKGYKGLVIKFGRPLSLYVSKGLDWAAGIPGTIEGAVYGNAGAFGKSMKDVVKSVEVFDTKTEKIEIFKDCQFGYRDSIFKKKKNLIILSVKIKSGKSDWKKIKEHLDYRKQRHPKLPSAGSVFKNVEETPVAILIHQAGLTGKKVGDAQISEKHSNFIVNLGNAKAKDVLKLIKLTKKSVKKKFGIVLEEEIQFL